MGLNRKSLLLIALLLTFYSKASAQNNIFYTDKYDANYFSNNSISSTELYLGSDLFQLLNSDNLNQIVLFIDSFLTDEQIEFDKNIVLENENRIKINIGNINAEQCNKLSVAWNEKYKVNFLKLVALQIDRVNLDSITWTGKKMIFYSLVMDERSRFFNPSNSVNNVNLAFVMSKKLSVNNFKVVFTHFNTKRYNARESELSATEIIYNNDLKTNELKFDFPSLNRQTFLKNCISLKILENIMSAIDLKTDYYINQCITSFRVPVADTSITEFSVYLDTNLLSEKQLPIEVQKAFNQIVQICNEHLFYYSYYDIQKLKLMLEEYNLSEFKKQIVRLNERKQFIISVNESNQFKINDIDLVALNRRDFVQAIAFKTNSIQFENEADSVLLNKLELFLRINANFALSISSTSKPSEYLFIEKDKRLALINQYTETGYVISKKKNLALYRSLTVFSRFTNAGIDYKRLKCIGLTGNSSELKLNIFSQDLNTK